MSDLTVGQCGVNVGRRNCPCEDYSLNTDHRDVFGEPQDKYCHCGHHEAMHLTVQEAD